MDRVELEDYKKFVKRQKDDEDFDTVSMKRLKDIYDKFYVSVDKSKYDHLFKKSSKKRLTNNNLYCIVKNCNVSKIISSL
jgi:hypothetical protein